MSTETAPSAPSLEDQAPDAAVPAKATPLKRLAQCWAAGSPGRQRTCAIFRRELCGYFRTPIAYVFLCVVLIALNGISWSGVGAFFEREDASLRSYFNLFPWIYLLLMPAVGMRLWAEERRSGTWELLLTYPVTVTQAVVAKFLAAWCFIGVALLLTFTMPITVSFLGKPDWGAMLAGYFGAFLMAGAYLAICSLASAMTRNQVIAFVLGLAICFLLLLAGYDAWSDFLQAGGLPAGLIEALANFSFIPHFEPMTKGLIVLRDVVFFLIVIVASLSLNIIALQRK